MKRVVAITVIMVIVTSLFSFSVYSASPSVFNDYSATASGSNVTIKLRALQFKSSSLGTSILPGGMESVFYVTCEIENNNTDAAILNPILFNLELTADKTISHMYSYSSDLLIEKETYFKIVPSSEFSYDGMIVVPPETTLYFIGEICTTANLDQTGQTVDDAGLRGIDFIGTGSYYIVGHGNYPYGVSMDLSPVITYIDGIEAALTTSNNNTTTIINRLNNIITLLTYSGNQYSASVDAASLYDSDNVSTDVSGFTYRIYRVGTPSHYIDNNIYYDEASDTYYQSGTKEIVLYYRISLINTSTNYVRLPRAIRLGNFLPAGNYTYDLQYDSEYFNCYFMSSNNTSNGKRLLIEFNNNDGSYGYVPPKSTMYLNVKLFVDYNDNQNITYTNPVWNNFTPAVAQDVYAPRNVYDILRDLYQSLTKKESDDNTEEAQDMNDDIHEQEQTWYDNNTEALENVGLSNYRFSQSQSSGITQAVTQFQAVWNALGNWTNVYIFILILSISTYIIRHEPTTRVKQYRSSVQAERAERISYYGRKNAESRAFASSGSTLKNAIRRRK